MTEAHKAALERLCRVCGKSLLASKGKRTTKYQCSENASELLDTFGLHISSDNPSIHPQCYCHPCRNIMYFTKRAKANKTDYKPTSLQIHQWVDHMHNEQCSVCTAISKAGRPKKPFKAGRPPNISPQAIIKHIREIAANSVTPDMDPANILNVPDELKCELCSSLLNKPIELTTCQKYACAECCCQSLLKAESLCCPCCGADHVADFCTVRQPPEAILAFIRSLTTNITHVIKKPSHIPLTPAEKKLQASLVTRSLSSDPEHSQTLQLQTGGQV